MATMRGVAIGWTCLPSHEGSGLKLRLQRGTEHHGGLPSREGSGLKLLHEEADERLFASPLV